MIYRGASNISCKPIMVHSISVLPEIPLKFYANVKFCAPSVHGKCGDVLQRDTHIAAELIHNLP